MESISHCALTRMDKSIAGKLSTVIDDMTELRVNSQVVRTERPANDMWLTCGPVACRAVHDGLLLFLNSQMMEIDGPRLNCPGRVKEDF